MNWASVKELCTEKSNNMIWSRMNSYKTNLISFKFPLTPEGGPNVKSISISLLIFTRFILKKFQSITSRQKCPEPGSVSGIRSTSLISIIISPINYILSKAFNSKFFAHYFSPLTPEGEHNASQLFISFYFSNLFDQTKFLPFTLSRNYPESGSPSGIRGKKLISIIISPINYILSKAFNSKFFAHYFSPLTPEGEHNASQLFISFYFSNLFDQTKFLPFTLSRNYPESGSPSWVRGNAMIYKLFFFILLLLTSCYSFRSAAVDPNIKSFTVLTFENHADNAPATIAINFTEKLKDKFRKEARLKFVDIDPDISFSGLIEDFSVSSQAPTAEQTSALSRLTIRVKVDFENKHDENKNWSQSFSFYQDFAGTQNLLDVQDGLITKISDQIVEDIYNKAFGDW